MAEAGTSLNKYISATGFCSRREADKLIEQARVTINDELVLPGTKVYAGDSVAIDGEPLRSQAKKRPIYIAFNKPAGVTSTTDLKDKTNIISYIGHPKRIFPVGRLDKDSDGLIFLTNDGDIVNKILRASNNHEKEYIVTVDKAITAEFVAQMSNGIPMLGTITRKCFVKQEGGRRFRITLTQGLNRQIRRMCEYLGYKVMTLTRVRIMNIQLGNLPVGKWRYFTPQETDKLSELVADSDKTHKPQGEERPNKKTPTAAQPQKELPEAGGTPKARSRTTTMKEYRAQGKQGKKTRTEIKPAKEPRATARPDKKTHTPAKAGKNTQAVSKPAKKTNTPSRPGKR